VKRADFVPGMFKIPAYRSEICHEPVARRIVDRSLVDPGKDALQRTDGPGAPDLIDA